MTRDGTIVIVGMPASGKSTVGHALAKRLGLPYADTDAIIEQRTGKLIREIFTDDGEEAFRRLEEETIAEALGERGVLALGGGAILSARTRERLRDHEVVWLDVSVATATRRAGLNQLRPLLLGDVRTRMQTLLDERLPLYHEVATLRVDTNRRSASKVAARIVAYLDGEDPDAHETDQVDGAQGRVGAEPDQDSESEGEA